MLRKLANESGEAFAVHESANGPSRHFAALPNLVAIGA